jgi:hypothetical protein
MRLSKLHLLPPLLLSLRTYLLRKLVLLLLHAGILSPPVISQVFSRAGEYSIHGVFF